MYTKEKCMYAISYLDECLFCFLCSIHLSQIENIRSINIFSKQNLFELDRTQNYLRIHMNKKENRPSFIQL